MLNKLYKELFLLPGISGFEKEIKEYLKIYFKKLPNYQIIQDNLGSIFAYKKSKQKDAPLIMVAGHMDEVGFLVVKIMANGALKLQPIGGISGEVLISQILNVHTEDSIIKGVIGAIPPHLKVNQSTNINDLILDIGAKNKDEAIKWGIKLGQMVTFENTFTYTHDKKRVISKAVDNRIGCGLAMQLASLFHDIELPYDIAFGATVQEEVGLRGVQTITNLLKPTIYIAIDSSPINDLLEPDSLGKMGEGAMLRIYDPGVIMPNDLRVYLETVAKTNNLKTQHYLSKGNTDATRALIANEGVIATSIVLPTRYIHSSAAMFEIADLESVKDMIGAVLNDLTIDKINKLLDK